MPRRIDPHLDERTDEFPSDRAERFQLPDAVKLAVASELPEGACKRALPAISHALAQYEWEKDVGYAKFTRAEAGEALRQLLSSPVIDFATVQALNERAYFDLFMLGNQDLRRWMLDSADRAVPVEAIKQAANRAAQMYKSRRGPDRDLPLGHLVRQLCEIFEDATGKVPTLHNKDVDRLYTEIPCLTGPNGYDYPINDQPGGDLSVVETEPKPTNKGAKLDPSEVETEIPF